MDKAKVTKTKRQQRLQEAYQPAGVCVSGSQFPDKPAAVPLDEWERYVELTCELEGAERFVHDIRQRLQTVKQQLACRTENHYCCVDDKSLERLIAAVPVTALLQ